MDKEEYTDRNIEYLDDLSENVADIKTMFIVWTIIQGVAILILAGFLFYLFMRGPI